MPFDCVTVIGARLRSVAAVLRFNLAFWPRQLCLRLGAFSVGLGCMLIRRIMNTQSPPRLNVAVEHFGKSGGAEK